METDIGNPIDYDPTIDNLKDDNNKSDNTEDLDAHSSQIDQYYYQQSPQMLYPPQTNQHIEKNDIFSNIEKSTWIIAFAVFLLGFFMGKTMQPVILRYT
jgi:hypothetical protein